MNSNHIKKQLESNLVPNWYRLLKGHFENGGLIIITGNSLIFSAIIASAASLVLRKLFAIQSSAVVFAIFVVAFLLALLFVGSNGKGSTTEYDDMGNEVDQSGIYGNGRRMSEAEKHGFLDEFHESDPKGTILGLDPSTGLCLGIPDDNRPFHESLDHRHILLFGGSGRGKSKFIKDRHRQLIYQGFSDIYTDPKGEHTEEIVWPCADAMEYRNKWLFFFSKDQIRQSNKIDLLKRVRTAEFPVVEAGWITDKVLGFKGAADVKEFWGASEKNLLTMSLVAASRCEGYVSIETFLSTWDSRGEIKEYGTWKTAVQVFKKKADEVDRYFLYLRSISEYNDGLLEGCYNSWRGDERNWWSHVGTIKNKLGILAEDGVSDIFSEDEVDLDAFVSEPSTIGLIYDVPPEEFASAFNLIIQLVVAAILKKKTKHKIGIVLEELKVTGVIDYLDEYLSYLRSYDTQIIGCIQAYSQLKKLYGTDEADSFFQNTHIVFVGGQESETIKKLEELTGSYGVIEQFSTSTVGGGAVRSTEGERIVQKSVVDKTELLYLKKGDIFVKLSNCGPIILNAYNSSKHPLANVGYVDLATGKCRKLSINEMTPDFDPEEKGLQLIGRTYKMRDMDRDYEDYLVED